MNKKNLKSVLDFSPLVVFFLCYKISGIYLATIAIVISTIITTFITYYIERKISWLPIITVIILAIMGGLTIFYKNDIFIKIKPTIINLLFAFILLIGLLRKKLFLKYIINNSLVMSDSAWRNFTLRWIGLFIFLAILNEIVWRNFSTDIWVNFKVFGILIITFVFMLLQYRFLRDNTVSS